MVETTEVAEEKGVRYMFIVRHGERADLAFETMEEYKGHPDAPLTERGHS